MNARTIALFAAVATLTQACVYVDDRPHQDPYIYEVEPNNFFFEAQGIGPISVGEQVLLRGHIADFGPDRFDGFAFQSVVPMDVEFALFSDDPNADFDLELFDPYTGTTVASWETGFNPETGRFSVVSSGFEFHLVVSSFFGSGSYTLEVRGFPLTWNSQIANGLAAQGVSSRADRALDWKNYAQAGADEDPVEDVPMVQITTIVTDPTTGRVEKVLEQRMPARAVLERRL